MIVTPSPWNSAHRPIPFSIGYDETYAWDYTSVTNENGLAQFTASGFNPYGTPPCKFMYVTGGVYQGFHVIKDIDTNGNILTYSPFQSTASGTDARLLVNLKYKLWYGYPTQTNSIEVRPFWKNDGTLPIDMSRFLASTFPSPVPPPVIGYDENMYTHFRIQIVAADDFKAFLDANSLTESTFIQTMTGWDWQDANNIWYCANAAILTSVLNSDHVSSGQYLAPQPPYYFQNFNTIYSIVVNDRIMNVLA